MPHRRDIGSVFRPPKVSQTWAVGAGLPEAVARRPLKGALLRVGEPLALYSDRDKAINQLIAADRHAYPAVTATGLSRESAVLILPVYPFPQTSRSLACYPHNVRTPCRASARLQTSDPRTSAARHPTC